MSTELHYTDPATGERVALDVDGWQWVITCSAGEVMRADLPELVMMVQLLAGGAPAFKVSLLKPDGFPADAIPAGDGWWIDMLVEKR